MLWCPIFIFIEQMLFSRMGMDKQTRETSKQIMWTWVFVPLVNTLLPCLPYAKWRKEERAKRTESRKPIIHDNVFKLASTLVHLRYPDRWKDEWQRAKSRCLPFL